MIVGKGLVLRVIGTLQLLPAASAVPSKDGSNTLYDGGRSGWTVAV